MDSDEPLFAQNNIDINDEELREIENQSEEICEDGDEQLKLIL